MPEDIFQRNIQFWGEDKQNILSNSSIIIAGVGGLGCTVGEILTRAGIGKLILVDHDNVSIPDLNRQILFDRSDLGKPKVEVAEQKLRAINPSIKIKIYKTDISELKKQHLPRFNGLADCLDNFSARFKLEALLGSDQFLVHGGVQNDFGQITTIKPGKTQTLKEIYSGIHVPVSIPVIPSIVIALGSLMAQEIINNLFNESGLLNKMLILELADLSMFKVDL